MDARKTIRNDSDMVTSPMEWPRWPLLPLKRRSGNHDEPNYCGFLIAVEPPPFVVFLATIYSLKPGKTWEQATEGMKIETYADVGSLLAVWTVD